MTHPLDLTVEEVKDCIDRALGGRPNWNDWGFPLISDEINALIESKRLAERGNSPGIGGIPNNHSNYDRDSKVGD